MAIDYEISDSGVAIVRYNNPAKMNAVSPQDVRRIIEVFDDLQRNPKVLVGIITGAGERAMSAGVDFRYMGTPEYESLHDLYQEYPGGLWTNMTPYMRGNTIWKPLIAAINGHAVAQAACAVLGTDIRLASTNATISFNEVLLKTIAYGGALARLPRQIPYTHAMYLLLTGRTMNAQEMLRCGLVLEVLEPAQLMPRALEIAEHIARLDRYAVQITKQAVVRGLDVGLHEAMVEEGLWREMLANRAGGTADSGAKEIAKSYRK